MEICTAAIELVLTGNNPTASQLPHWYDEHYVEIKQTLGKGAEFSVPASSACVRMYLFMKVCQLFPTSISKQYTDSCLPIQAEISSALITPLGRTSVSQATDKQAYKNLKHQPLILNAFPHLRAASNY